QHATRRSAQLILLVVRETCRFISDGTPSRGVVAPFPSLYVCLSSLVRLYVVSFRSLPLSSLCVCLGRRRRRNNGLSVYKICSAQWKRRVRGLISSALIRQLVRKWATHYKETQSPLRQAHLGGGCENLP